MPWKEFTTMSQRREFVGLALQEGANISRLCREFGICRKTGYKWLERFRDEGSSGLSDRSRRPHSSPNRTPASMEQKVVSLRDKHPAWGGRKIHRRLSNLGMKAPPPPSTITGILRRHGRLDPEESRKHRAWKRFEAEAPNDVLQIDFKGHFPLANGERCHPLTVLDDHSRFSLGLQACTNEQRETVQSQLTAIFRRYGLPKCILADNGPPWGTTPQRRLTRLGVWLVQLGISIQHTGPYHPQTIGKDERFHRTIGEEVLKHQVLRSISHAQERFDAWRDVYNQERPHEGIGMAVPASRYCPSKRTFPETLHPIIYQLGAMLRRVDMKGCISFKGRTYRVGRTLWKHTVEIRPTEEDGVLDVYFSHQKVETIDLRRNLISSANV